MQGQLRRISEEFDAASIRLHRLVDGIPPERGALRNESEKWSVAECVAHLNLTGGAYVPLIRAGLDSAAKLGVGARSRYRRDPVGWLLSVAMGPLPRLGRFQLGKVRTSMDFEPGPGPEYQRTMNEFDRLQREQVRLVLAADGLPIDRVRINSPFDPRLRYNLYSALCLLPRHQERHIAQAASVWPDL